MPNWMSDEDRALDSGDATTCQYCGKVTWVDEWHFCEEEREASRKSTAAFTKNYKADGSKLKTRLIIDIECFNTKSAFQDVLNDISCYFEEGEHSDEVLEYAWKLRSIEDINED